MPENSVDVPAKRGRPCHERIPRIFTVGTSVHDTSGTTLFLAKVSRIWISNFWLAIARWRDSEKEKEKERKMQKRRRIVRSQEKKFRDEAASDSSNWNTGTDTRCLGIFCWDSSDFCRDPFRPEIPRNFRWNLSHISLMCLLRGRNGLIEGRSCWNAVSLQFTLLVVYVETFRSREFIRFVWYYFCHCAFVQ